MSTIDSSYFDPRGLRELLSSALRETVSHSATGLVTVAVPMLPVALLQLVAASAERQNALPNTGVGAHESMPCPVRVLALRHVASLSRTTPRTCGEPLATSC